MTLDKIILNNFGIYGGRQEIELTPPSVRKPVILIGALNGSGKTTLLDAIQLVFYGRNARVSSRGKRSYRDYLRTMVHRGHPIKKGASVELEFHRIVEGKLTRFRIVRSWFENKKGEIEELIEVDRDGKYDSLLSEHWDEFIESYLPSSISHLFFFDGEQIAELADSDKASALLKTAVESLLGLDLVERLRNDLVVLERRKKALFHDDADQSEVNVIEKELERLDREKHSASDKHASITTKLSRLKSQLAKLKNQFRKDGGELFEHAENLIKEKETLEKKFALCQQELRDIAAGVGPLLLVQDLLEQVEVQATRELEAKQNKLTCEMLEQRDGMLIGKVKGEISASFHKKLEALLRKDRRQRADVAACTEFWLNPDENLPLQIKSLNKTILPEVRAKVQILIDQCDRFREEITRLEEKLAAVPDEDDIAELQKQIVEKEQLITEQRAADLLIVEKIRQLEFQYTQTERDRNRFFEKVAEQQIEDDDARRILLHSPKVRETLEKFRAAVVRNHTKRIEDLVLEALNHLLRKNSLVSGLSIHPESFAIELTGGNGEPLPFDRLSAGERQLLATALLWGLAKASGRPIPTIIDTPLGRLDSFHRSHLVERYFPAASHQVILLSTDEEIDHRYLKKLKPFIGRSYSLEFDDTTNSNTAREGYFPEYETAS